MNAPALADIAAQASPLELPLAWVGMRGIALPVTFAGQRLACRVDAGVSLDAPATRGIHMSRLFLGLEALTSGELALPGLQEVLRGFLDSHAGLSQDASLDIHGELLLSRPALVSPLAGWKGYPFVLRSRLDMRGFHVELQLEVGYSSTCPCSAALARQLIQARFMEDFAGRSIDPAEVVAWLGSTQGIVATPHSQRSRALLRLSLEPGQVLQPTLWIDRVEAALGTALQTAVRRADEQAFALANGQNLMFCEDAARRVHLALAGSDGLLGFELEVLHAESLHAHDAVALSRWRRPAG